MKNLLEWIRDIVIAVIIAAIILAFFKPIIVQQESMQPNFYSGDYLITSRQAYRLFGQPERGDVIVFKSHLYDEKGKQKNLIKRIIGLPGDTVEIKNGDVYINGELLQEEYVAEQGLSGEMEAVTVPEGRLFVMGDNRRVSQDSRSPEVGTIEMDSIVGKVVLRLYPFNQIKVF
ncbi:MAG: signal peptidase I [Anaerovoracaceae bacterium]|nr:signal peptidase I [Bacillota bacterium]MDY5771124.1 signal peptidase I [Anaerovoracaceae bacterium]